MKERGLIRDSSDSKTHRSRNAIDHIFYNSQTVRKFNTKYAWRGSSDHKIILLDLADLKVDN